jgi:hypothetical protein
MFISQAVFNKVPESARRIDVERNELAARRGSGGADLPGEVIGVFEGKVGEAMSHQLRGDDEQLRPYLLWQLAAVHKPMEEG